MTFLFVFVFVCLVVFFIYFFVLKESCIINKVDQSVPLALNEKFNKTIRFVISFPTFLAKMTSFTLLNKV